MSLLPISTCHLLSRMEHTTITLAVGWWSRCPGTLWAHSQTLLPCHFWPVPAATCCQEGNTLQSFWLLGGGQGVQALFEHTVNSVTMSRLASTSCHLLWRREHTMIIFGCWVVVLWSRQPFTTQTTLLLCHCFPVPVNCHLLIWREHTVIILVAGWWSGCPGNLTVQKPHCYYVTAAKFQSVASMLSWREQAVILLAAGWWSDYQGHPITQNTSKQ